MRISQNLDLLRLPVPNIFLALFPSFFSVLLLSLPFAFYILSGWLKKLGVYQGQSLEMGPWSVIGIMGHFTTIFAPKLITLSFDLVHQNVVDTWNNDCCADRSILVLPCAYQECLVTSKLMTSQVVQRALPLSGRQLGVKGLLKLLPSCMRRTGLRGSRQQSNIH